MPESTTLLSETERLNQLNGMWKVDAFLTRVEKSYYHGTITQMGESLASFREALDRQKAWLTEGMEGPPWTEKLEKFERIVEWFADTKNFEYFAFVITGGVRPGYDPERRKSLLVALGVVNE